MVNNQIEENRGHETLTTLQSTCTIATMNNQQSNTKPTPRVSSSQKSSAPAPDSLQAAKMNSAPPVTWRDPTPPTVARKRGHPKQPRIEKTHKSSPLPRSPNRNDTDDSSTSDSGGDRPHKARKNDRHGQPLMDTRRSSIVRLSTAGATKRVPTPSSNPFQEETLLASSRDMIAPTAALNNTLHRASQPLSAGGSIAPDTTINAIPSTRCDSTSVQAAPPRSGSRVAPTPIPRARTIFDATEALKKMVRAKSFAGISNPQADRPRQAIPPESSKSNIAQTTQSAAKPRMTAAKRRAQEEGLLVARAQEKSSDLAYLAALESAFRDAAFYTPERDSFYDKQPVQSASRPKSFYDHQPVQSDSRQNSLYDPQPVQSAFPQPSALKNPQHDEELKCWQQSLWNDGGMM
jgi:hypothetical protein